METTVFPIGKATLEVPTIELLHAWLNHHLAVPTQSDPFAPPALADGEIYVGMIVAGDRRDHIILLSGERESVSHADATTWATSIGGELPDRVESALLFATLKSQFSENWYWSSEQHTSLPDYAWLQNFSDGSQTCSPKSYSYRARAIRRSPIRPFSPFQKA